MMKALLLFLISNILVLTWPFAEEQYTLWDGKEAIADYAVRNRLLSSKSIDLGNGIRLDFVLIPAGRYLIGTPTPESEWNGLSILLISCGVILILIGWVIVKCIIRRKWPQYSLRWLICLVFAIGFAEYGVIRWRASANAWIEFRRVIHLNSPYMVSIVAPFYMGKYEVTGEQYAEVMGSDPSKFGYPRHPVENVTWRDAKEFCRRVTEISGYVVRMPSEDEWECACGRESWIKCNIELEDSEYDVGWHSQNSSSSSHAVGDKIGNVFGLHDTMGNVSEWCKDEYMGFLTRPHSGGRCKHLRAIRGGNWRFAKQKCQPHVRDSRPLDCSYDYVGFRVVSEVSKISSVQAWEDMCK